MGDLRPAEPVKEHYGLSLKGKAVLGTAILAVLGLAVFGFYYASQKTKENQTANQQKQAREAESGDQTVKEKEDLRKGLDPAADQGDAEFVKIAKGFDEQQKHQKANEEMARQQAEQEAVAKARKEGFERGQNPQGGAGVPGSVGPNGLAKDGSRVMTPEEVSTQQRQTQMAGPQVPPEAPVDPSEWVITPWGRMRPAYQSGKRFSPDQGAHQEMEKAYLQAFYSPMVVGLSEGENAAMHRLNQDLARTPGAFGPQTRPQRLDPKTSRVGGFRTAPAPAKPVAGNWGNWITVEPAPAQKK